MRPAVHNFGVAHTSRIGETSVQGRVRSAFFSGSSSIDHQFRGPVGKVDSIAQGTSGLEDTTMRLVMPTPRERPEALVFEAH